jgi:hypothetical protein
MFPTINPEEPIFYGILKVNEKRLTTLENILTISTKTTIVYMNVK